MDCRYRVIEMDFSSFRLTVPAGCVPADPRFSSGTRIAGASARFWPPHERLSCNLKGQSGLIFPVSVFSALCKSNIWHLPERSAMASSCEKTPRTSVFIRWPSSKHVICLSGPQRLTESWMIWEPQFPSWEAGPDSSYLKASGCAGSWQQTPWRPGTNPKWLRLVLHQRLRRMTWHPCSSCCSAAARTHISEMFTFALLCRTADWLVLRGARLHSLHGPWSSVVTASVVTTHHLTTKMGAGLQGSGVFVPSLCFGISSISTFGLVCPDPSKGVKV